MAAASSCVFTDASLNAGPTPANLDTNAISRTIAGAVSGTSTGVLLDRKSGCCNEYDWSCSHADGGGSFLPVEPARRVAGDRA